MPAEIEPIRERFNKGEFILSLHALKRAAEREIDSSQMTEAVNSGEIIEDYPNDKYGPSCLIFGRTSNSRPLHIQVSYPDITKVITVYEPSLQEWEDDLRMRKRDE